MRVLIIVAMLLASSLSYSRATDPYGEPGDDPALAAQREMRNEAFKKGFEMGQEVGFDKGYAQGKKSQAGIQAATELLDPLDTGTGKVTEFIYDQITEEK